MAAATHSIEHKSRRDIGAVKDCQSLGNYLLVLVMVVSEVATLLFDNDAKSPGCKAKKKL